MVIVPAIFSYDLSSNPPVDKFSCCEKRDRDAVGPPEHISQLYAANLNPLIDRDSHVTVSNQKYFNLL